jgi:hypothetical protein
MTSTTIERAAAKARASVATIPSQDAPRQAIPIEGWYFGIEASYGNVDETKPSVVASPYAGPAELIEWGLSNLSRLDVLLLALTDATGLDVEPEDLAGAIRHFTQQAYAAIRAGADRMESNAS